MGLKRVLITVKKCHKMVYYRNPIGVLRSLVLELCVLLTGAYFALLISLKTDFSIAWSLGLAGLFAALILWRSIYQSSHASIMEHDEKIWYSNGLWKKCLGSKMTVRVRSKMLFGLIRFIEGDEGSIISFKGDYALR